MSTTVITENNIIIDNKNQIILIDLKNFLINLEIPLNLEIIEKLKEHYKNYHIFKKVIIDDYNKRLFINIITNDVVYSQYRIKNLICQIYTIGDIIFKKFYDVYLKKYILIKYINNFDKINKSDIQQLIKKLNVNKILEINIYEEMINIKYDEYNINIFFLKTDLYFMTYIPISNSQEYAEIISNCVETDVLEYMNEKVILDNIDITYNYLYVNLVNTSSFHNYKKIRKIISIDNIKIFDAYYNYDTYFNNIFNRLVYKSGDNFNVLKYTKPINELIISINDIPVNFDKLSKVGIYLPIVMKTNDQNIFEQFLFGKYKSLKLAIINDDHIDIYTYNEKAQLLEHCKDYIEKIHKTSVYYNQNMKVIREIQNIKSINSNKITEKYYIDDYTAEIKTSKNNNIKYTKITFLKKNKMLLLKKGFNVLKKFINKISNFEYNLINDYINSFRNTKEYLYNLNKEQYIEHEKTFSFGYTFGNLDGDRFGIINSIAKIIMTEDTDDNTKKTIYNNDKDGHIEEKTEINNNIVTLIDNSNKNLFLTGYKATLDDDNNYCITELEIPLNSHLIKDEKYNKNRTDTVRVKYIGQVFKINDKFYYDNENTEECYICNNEHVQMKLLIPCCHKLCITCCDSIKTLSNLCPFCNSVIDTSKPVKNLYKSFSFIHTRIIYKLNDTIKIENFNDDITKVCGSGIHYHDNIKDTHKWFEFRDIPENL